MSLEGKEYKCYGVGEVLKKPFGLGLGVDVTLYVNSEDGIPQKIGCPFAVGTHLVSCAAGKPKVIDEYEKGVQGCLKQVPLCYRLHPSSR